MKRKVRVDNNKKIAIEQDALSIKSILDQYTSEEKLLLSRFLTQNKSVGLNVYNNPIVVSVALIPIIQDYQLKLLGVRRGIPPFVGELAFPGGFVEPNETVAGAAARETSEEAGVILQPGLFKIVEEKITPNNQLLVFSLYTEALSAQLINLNFKNAETQELKLLDPSDVLCFSLHEEVKQTYFKSLYQAPRRKP